MIETGLHDKVVIVTGAAAGIGNATARRFAQEGCRVASWDVRDGEPTPGGLFRKVDVTNATSVEAGVEEVMAQWGAVHVLVNNRSEEHTSELQSLRHLVCRLLL